MAELSWFVGRSIFDGRWHVSEKAGEMERAKRWFTTDGRIISYEEFMSERTPHETILFPTEAEAKFRLLLYQNPREALQPFFEATGGEYRGACGRCLGSGLIESFGRDDQVDADGNREMEDCPTCSGTGGPPDNDTLLVAADWFEERDCEMQAVVLRDVAKGGE